MVRHISVDPVWSYPTVTSDCKWTYNNVPHHYGEFAMHAESLLRARQGMPIVRWQMVISPLTITVGKTPRMIPVIGQCLPHSRQTSHGDVMNPDWSTYSQLKSKA